MFKTKTTYTGLKTSIALALLILLATACAPPKKSADNGVLVYCAVSLTDVISEISGEFENETGIKVKLNLASSGTLARQIEMGAVPDLYISANRSWLDYLDERGKLRSDSKIKIAGNRLVLIAPSESDLEPVPFTPDLDLPSLFKGRLSIGDPQHVPAGAYAVELLKSLHCLSELQPRFLPAKDVRSALMVVELGEAEAGIVYKTDALKSQKVKVITEFPDSLYQPVSYNMAFTKGRKNDRSLQLYNYIVSDKLQPVWKKYGFKN